MLNIDKIDVAIAARPILRGVSLRLESGQTGLLHGRNGAGKTTTLRAVMGLLPLSGGQVSVGGSPLDQVPAYGRAALGIGYAPEDRRIYPGLSIEQNLLLPTVALRMGAAEARERLADVYGLMPELDKLKERPGASLSGGQGKMVALGRALMIGTRLVLLDEPFQGLAPALALSYAETLTRVRERYPELAILVTESSPQLLSGTIDRVFEIERGEISEEVPAL